MKEKQLTQWKGEFQSLRKEKNSMYVHMYSFAKP